MLIRKTGLYFIALVLTGSVRAFAGDACSLLTSAEVEAALKAKVTNVIPVSVAPEYGCLFQLGQDQVVLSYFTDSSKRPKSSKEDPFLRGAAGPNVKDYGNFGCHIVNGQVLFSTNCNRYQPSAMHMEVKVHAKSPVPMDVVKGLLEKAASRLK